MLTPMEVALYASSVLILLPLVIWSLSTGSKVPENSVFGKYYAAEPYLGLVGNLFLLAVIATALLKLAMHFGLVDGSVSDTATMVVNVPFLTLLAGELFLWFRAIRKVRRTASVP